MVDFEIIGHVTLARLGGFEDQGEILGLRLHRNLVAFLALIGGDVDALAVDPDMAVIDQLARGERGRSEFEAIDDGVQPALEQADQVFRGVAATAHGLVIQPAELLLTDIAVVTLQLLLGHQLGAEIGRLLAALTVLAGGVLLAAVEWALGAAPQIGAQAAVDLVLGFNTLGHGLPSGRIDQPIRRCPDSPDPPWQAGRGGRAERPPARFLGREGRNYTDRSRLVK